MWSLVAVNRLLKKRLAGRVPPPVESVADKIWNIAPAETTITPPAYFLPNQLERVTGWVFADEHPRRDMEGGVTINHVATRAFLLKDACLIDGALSKKGACSYVRPRSSRWPRFHVEHEFARAAIYCSFGGNKWFAQWLLDDCVTYPLAAAEGLPIAVGPAGGVHVSDYEARLGMESTRIESAFFKEVVIFEDFSQNQHRHRRYRALRDRLLAGVEARSHPGVFIVRGLTGERRHLLNEMEVAEHLRSRRGFQIVDPTKCDVATIVKRCAGARVVVGIEGSGMAHGTAVLAPGGAILTLQPPNRFVKFYKPYADCNRQHFGFVVGFPENEGFRVDPAEVERTLDLFPPATSAGLN